MKVINRHNAALTVLCTIAYIFACCPLFGMTGNIFAPVIWGIIIGAVISACTVELKKSSVAGYSQIIFITFWIIFALVKEFAVQLEAGFADRWIQYFYFDKFLVVGSVWLGSTLYICFIRLLSKKTNISEYSGYFRYSGVAFIIFYTFLLVYSFVLIRIGPGEYPIRLIPFYTIKNYIQHYSVDPYETLMNVFGNLFYFTPLGYILCRKVYDKKLGFRICFIFVFPIFAFSCLELSQYLFQNGYCEFDDISMNTVGFWLGALLCPLTNFLARKISRNRCLTFWN
ncbi:MAG: VanZ family protein [Clostridia bacterium]|nr:VanZ family protein [Clostridia bacterium]